MQHNIVITVAIHSDSTIWKDQPMDDTLNFTETVAKSRERFLQTLVRLASEGRSGLEAKAYQERAERVRAEFDKADSALRQILPESKIGTNRYAHHDEAVDAIRDFLTEIGRPASPEEIIREVVRGGFRGGGDGVSHRIKRSISSFTKGTGRMSGKIKQVGDYIGLGEWDDSHFNLTDKA